LNANIWSHKNKTFIYFKKMNNRQLNREFSQVMNDRNRFKKSGFTDSEDEDEETTNKCKPKMNYNQ
jgi:hypothetical protein